MDMVPMVIEDMAMVQVMAPAMVRLVTACILEHGAWG